MNSYDTICLGGGGLKGICELGALHYLYFNEYYNTDNIRFYIGTSVGSIICVLLSIGYKPIELFAKIIKTDVSLDLDLTHLSNFKESRGIFDINILTKHVEQLIINKLNKIPSLMELFNITNKELFIVTTNYSDNCCEYLHYSTHPNLSCIEAIKMSSALPWIFDRITYNNKIYVDGGVANNFPFKKATEIGERVIGIRVGGSINDDDLMTYAYRIISISIQENEKLQLSNVNKNHFFLTINTNESGITMNDNTIRKKKLFEQGYDAAEHELLSREVNFEW